MRDFHACKSLDMSLLAGVNQAGQLLRKPPLLLRAGGKLLSPFRKNLFASLRASSSVSAGAPVAREENKETTMHGRTRIDQFHWMKDDNWQQVLREPEVLRSDIREHLEKENLYTDSVLAPTKALRDRLFKEMKGRISEVDASVPSKGKLESDSRLHVVHMLSNWLRDLQTDPMLTTRATRRATSIQSSHASIVTRSRPGQQKGRRQQATGRFLMQISLPRATNSSS